MSSEALSTLAAAMSAIAAVAALALAWLGLRQARSAAHVAQKVLAREMDDSLQNRLDPLYPELRRILGHMEDGVPMEIRHTMIPFFVLFSDAFGAHRDGLLDDRDWVGLERELSYWTQKPHARRAWAAFRNQTWTEGFVEFVDAVVEGPPAYPNVRETTVTSGIDWPEEKQS